MTKKRSRNPQLRAFGAWLADRRGNATREQISIKLKALYVPLGGSTLAQYEKGTVWSPDPAVLWGLAKIYGVALEQVIELLKANRANPTLELRDLAQQLRTPPVPGDDHAREAADLRVLFNEFLSETEERARGLAEFIMRRPHDPNKAIGQAKDSRLTSHRPSVAAAREASAQKKGRRSRG